MKYDVVDPMEEAANIAVSNKGLVLSVDFNKGLGNISIAGTLV